MDLILLYIYINIWKAAIRGTRLLSQLLETAELTSVHHWCWQLAVYMLPFIVSNHVLSRDVSMATMQAALEVQDTKIADELINNILQISYQGLSTKLKKVWGCESVREGRWEERAEGRGQTGVNRVHWCIESKECTVHVVYPCGSEMRWSEKVIRSTVNHTEVHFMTVILPRSWPMFRLQCCKYM